MIWLSLKTNVMRTNHFRILVPVFHFSPLFNNQKTCYIKRFLTAYFSTHLRKTVYRMTSKLLHSQTINKKQKFK